MLLNCKVFRKRNSNVSPTSSQHSKFRETSPTDKYFTINPSKNNPYLKEMELINKSAQSAEKLNQVIRTAGTGRRPSNEKYDDVMMNNRASTCENVGHRTQRFGMSKEMKPLNPLPSKQLIKPR